MSRLELPTPSKAQLVVEGLYKDLERRIEASLRDSAQLISPGRSWSCVMLRHAANAFPAELAFCS